jgi:hypothetical protein
MRHELEDGGAGQRRGGGERRQDVEAVTHGVRRCDCGGGVAEV